MKLLITFLALFSALPLWAETPTPSETPSKEAAAPLVEFKAQLHRLSETTALLGVTLTPESGWHTYWSNPGDAGMALSLQLEDESILVQAEDFPVPERFEKMGIVGYGYNAPATMLYYLTGEFPDTLKGRAIWLVCDDSSCVAKNEEFSLTLPTLQTEGAEDPAWLIAAEQAQPKRLEAEPVSITAEGKTQTITFHAAADIADWEVYPYNEELSPTEKWSTVLQGEDESYVLRFDLTGELSDNLAFLVKGEDNKAYKLTLTRP